jgi:integrase
MSSSLFNQSGCRKYLVAEEREAFVNAACVEGGLVGAFCLTLVLTGARISEALAITTGQVDNTNGSIVLETLKQRKRGVFRAVPVPPELLCLLRSGQHVPRGRIWQWGRTTAWKSVKRVMMSAHIAEWLCQPKALRHGFAIAAGQNGVPLNVVQRWLGHSRIETTAIYSNAIGEEERILARRAWKTLENSALWSTNSQV